MANEIKYRKIIDGIEEMNDEIIRLTEENGIQKDRIQELEEQISLWEKEI